MVCRQRAVPWVRAGPPSRTAWYLSAQDMWDSRTACRGTCCLRSLPPSSSINRSNPMHEASRIFVAGHTGLAGSALRRRLEGEGFSNLLLRTHAELDLRNQSAVERFFSDERPEFVFLAAAKVGGIAANSAQPADF